ncbi:MAG: hypothetical protein CK431_10200 [Mycobacterium sp.]|nr:MAG: hypothetical protein CK431_10200 [Mycobacterium sp.]
MARPSTTDEVTDRRVRLAQFDFEQFATHPKLVKAYADFVEAAREVYQNCGAEEELSCGSVAVYRGATDEELEKQLRLMQLSWDHRKKEYDKAAEQGVASIPDNDLRGYRINGIRSFAKAEGLADPFAREVEA